MADKPFHNPFGALAGLRGIPPGAEKPSEAAAPAEAPQHPATSDAMGPPDPQHDRRGPARAVVRIERSGRRGKAVTVIEHLGLPPADRDRWLNALKTSLGCGGTLEGEAIVLQGDQRPRVPALLAARGVRKVTVS